MRRIVTALSTVAVCVSLVTTVVAQEPVRQSRQTAVSFHLASTYSLPGMEATSLGRDQTIYVSKHAIMTAAEVTGADAIVSRDGSDIELTLSTDTASRLANESARSGADMLAILVSGKVVAAGPVSVDPTSGVATISRLEAVNAERLSNLISGTTLRLGPVITLVASNSSIAPGGEVIVDAYVSGVADLRTYQLSLLINGGTAGKLQGQDLWVDQTRDNYVFGTEAKLGAVDKTGGRIGGVLINGSVEAKQSSYLGTFSLRATDDAVGMFTIDIKTAASSSLIWTSKNQPVSFGTQAVVIMVGNGPRNLRTK